MTTKGAMTVAEAGRRGGRTTARLHPEQFAAIGKLGGDKTLQRHGPQFFEKIGRKGGRRVRDLVRKGKRAEGKAR